MFEWAFLYYSGNDLDFRAAARQVLSAQESLTSVFGMGTGGTSPLLSPEDALCARTPRLRANGKLKMENGKLLKKSQAISF